jgi:DNA-binding LacI/PurR family transcriptional regulator
MKRTTSADVAREAGVSRTTVSYVLNDTPHQQIPDTTRDRVLEAAGRLSYFPSAAARALVRGRSDVILFFLPAEVTLTDWSRQVLTQLSKRFAQEGFTLLAHTGRFGHDRLDDVWRTIMPAAVMCISVEPDQVLAMRAAGVPLVLPLYGGNDAIQSITMDTERAVLALQLQTLIDAGHERIAFASLDSAHRLSTAAYQMLLPGVASALGIEVPPHHAFPEDPDAAATVLRDITAAGYTAICAVNDHIAGVVLAGARRAGIAVPDQVAVIGAGNQVLSAVTEPALTTVANDADQLAESLIDIVTRLINALPAPTNLSAPRVTLVRRDSV